MNMPADESGSAGGFRSDKVLSVLAELDEKEDTLSKEEEDAW